MRNVTKLGVVMIAVLALTAIAAATASAGTFNSTITGAFSGNQNSPIEINLNGEGGGGINRVTCNVAKASGTINKLESSELTTALNSSSCSAFLGIAANVSTSSWLLTSAGTNNHVAAGDFTNTTTITVGSGGNNCTVTISPQNDRTNIELNGFFGLIMATFSVTNLTSTGNGGVCGTMHNSGSVKGSVTVGISGGTLNYVP